MSTEKKIRPWEPIENLAELFYIYAIYDDHEGFRVILTGYDDKTKDVLINFRGVMAYRVTDEIMGIHMLDGYSIEPFKNGKPLSPWTLFTLTNSEYLKWASDQSNTASESLGLIHYLISTEDESLEVLSYTTPIVEFIDVPETINNVGD